VAAGVSITGRWTMIVDHVMIDDHDNVKIVDHGLQDQRSCSTMIDWG